MITHSQKKEKRKRALASEMKIYFSLLHKSHFLFLCNLPPDERKALPSACTHYFFTVSFAKVAISFFLPTEVKSTS